MLGTSSPKYLNSQAINYAWLGQLTLMESRRKLWGGNSSGGVIWNKNKTYTCALSHSLGVVCGWNGKGGGCFEIGQKLVISSLYYVCCFLWSIVFVLFSCWVIFVLISFRIIFVLFSFWTIFVLISLRIIFVLISFWIILV